ncbi:MAG: hypothetical protein ABGZ35_08675 [Planctomycetaceae bacterium]
MRLDPPISVLKVLATLAVVITLPIGCSESASSDRVGTPAMSSESTHVLSEYIDRHEGDLISALQDAALQHKGGSFRLDDKGALVKLALMDISVSAAELKQIAAQHSLRSLYITNGHINDSALVHLATLSKLETLGLDSNPISDLSISHITSLRNLQKLDLRETQVSDAGVTEIFSLRNLRRLLLGGTNISDQSTASLTNLSGLEELWIYDTKMTPAGVDSIRDALPDCRVRDEL